MSSPSSSSSKTKALSYPDAIKVFNDEDVIAQLGDTCLKLAQTSFELLKAFETISTQLHTFDMQGQTAPLKPRWASLQKDFSDLLWQHRANAGYISGRLRMFCTVILPLTIRNTGQYESASGSSYEKAQVLQSYMNISSDHAALTQKLSEHALDFNSNFNSFHTEFAKIASQRVTSGQRELKDLVQKLSELETVVKEIHLASGQVSEADVTYLAFAALRMCASSGKRTTTRMKISHKQLALHGTDLNAIAKLYNRLDYTETEMAHAHYASQVSQRKTDITTTIRTEMSSLVSDEMLTIETTLSYFMAIWSRLQADCYSIFQWLQTSSDYTHTPPCVTIYQESGRTLYMTIAETLDVYIAAMDPSHFQH